MKKKKVEWVVSARNRWYVKVQDWTIKAVTREDAVRLFINKHGLTPYRAVMKKRVK